MTETQKKMAVALGCCTFVPGIGTKRFARSMAEAAGLDPSPELTDKQAHYLASAVVRYRRQIERGVVLAAELELAKMAAHD